MSNIAIISIKDSISSHLAIRKSAISFFENKIAKLPAKSLEIDFSDIESMSHSFAHQYILNKRSSDKQINEVNVPINIYKMFEMARNSIDTPRKPNLAADQEIPTGELKL